MVNTHIKGNMLYNRCYLIMKHDVTHQSPSCWDPRGVPPWVQQVAFALVSIQITSNYLKYTPPIWYYLIISHHRGLHCSQDMPWNIFKGLQLHPHFECEQLQHHTALCGRLYMGCQTQPSQSLPCLPPRSPACVIAPSQTWWQGFDFVALVSALRGV